MNLSVNGQKIDITLENEKTIGEVLKSFEKEMEANEATTIKIVLDGKEVSSNEFDKVLNDEIKDNTTLDLSVVSKVEIISALHNISDIFFDLSEKLIDIPVLLQSGKDKAASELIEKLAMECNNFCHITTMTMLFPDVYSKLLINGSTLNDFFKEFLPILNDFESALKDKDSVTLGDISEYEIVPRLQNIVNAIKTI